MSKTQSKLLFQGVEISSVNFDSQHFYDGKSPINFDVIPKIFYNKMGDDEFKIIMLVNISSDGFFNIDLNAIGGFNIIDPNNEIKSKQKESFANLNAPAIMFPYVRAFIATFTGNIGTVIPRINLPTQFFDQTLEIIDLNETD